MKENIFSCFLHFVFVLILTLQRYITSHQKSGVFYIVHHYIMLITYKLVKTTWWPFYYFRDFRTAYHSYYLLLVIWKRINKLIVCASKMSTWFELMLTIPSNFLHHLTHHQCPIKFTILYVLKCVIFSEKSVVFFVDELALDCVQFKHCC